MLHYSCDMCGQPLDEERFVARVEVYPAFDPDELTEADLDADHMQQVADLLNDIEAGIAQPPDECEPRQFRFDLCPRCHTMYLKDPLGREKQRRLNFSEN